MRLRLKNYSTLMRGCLFTAYETEWDAAGTVKLSGVLPLAGIRFERQISLARNGVVNVTESLENLSASDRPIAWTNMSPWARLTSSPGKHNSARLRVSQR